MHIIATMSHPPAGVIILDKPSGASSARAVTWVKHMLPKGTKIGHAGTLDPFATGVLLLLVGRATKSCEKLMDAPKQYEAVVKFGATTATDDPESAEEPWSRADGNAVAPVDPATIGPLLQTFVGEILQNPPAFSALKVGGRRAYDLARKGVDVQLAARPVKVYGIEPMRYAWPQLQLRIDCGRGTYIRSLARDIGAALDVGGHLTALRRTRIGAFDAAESVTIEQLREDGVERFLRPVEALSGPLSPVLGEEG